MTSYKRLSGSFLLEQWAVHAHEIVFFSREAWTVHQRHGHFESAFMKERGQERCFCLRKIMHERISKMCVYNLPYFLSLILVEACLHQSHREPFLNLVFWNALSGSFWDWNNSLELCAVHAHEIVCTSRGKHEQHSRARAFWISVSHLVIMPSQNKYERSLITNLKANATFTCLLHIFLCVCV